MKLKKTLTVLSIGALITTASVQSFAAKSISDENTGNILYTSNITQDLEEDLIITPYALLYEHNNLSSPNGKYRSTDFATPNSNDVNVYFKSKGTSTATVTFYKKGWFINSKIGSFNVLKGGEDFKRMPGSKGTYYIEITNSDGSPIKGDLRARQL